MLAVLVLIAPSLEAQVWRMQSSGTTVKLWKIFFVDSARGWACGELGTILRTIDGGEHWNRCTVPDTTMPYFSLFFLDSLRGWAVGRLNVIHTTDAGDSWAEQTSPKVGGLNAVLFLDKRTGFAAGLTNTRYGVIRTTDGG